MGNITVTYRVFDANNLTNFFVDGLSCTSSFLQDAVIARNVLRVGEDITVKTVSQKATEEAGMRGFTTLVNADPETGTITMNVDGVQTVVSGKVLAYGLATADGYFFGPAIPLNATDQRVYTGAQEVNMTSEASFVDEGIVMVPINSEACGDDRPVFEDAIEVAVPPAGKGAKTIKVQPTCSQAFYLFKGRCLSGTCFKERQLYTIWKLERNGLK